MVKLVELWHIPPEKEGVPIYAVAFQPPDGTLVAATKGKHVLILNSNDGTTALNLRGHKGTVCALAWSNDGSLLASGGSYNTTIIWDANEGKGILKFNHQTPIQALSFNPVSNVLATCASDDFGLWSDTTRRVSKHKVESKVLDCSWSTDGIHLALAHESGHISVFDSEENTFIAGIDCCDAPVCCIEWIPTTDRSNCFKNQLVYGSQNSLSYYDMNVGRVVKKQGMSFMPCSLSYSGGQLVAAGNKGYFFDLARVSSDTGHLIWSACCSPDGLTFATGAESGDILVYSIDYPASVAVELNMRLHQWDKARQLAEETGCVEKSVVTKRQADGALQTAGVDTAIAIFVENREYLSAIELVGKEKPNGWENAVMEIVRASHCQMEIVSAAEMILTQANATKLLVELHLMSNNYTKLLHLQIQSRNWVAANKILDEHAEAIDGAGTLRAQILVMQGQFLPAFNLYCQIGRLDMARKIMIELSNSASQMSEYKDAGHNLWILANALRADASRTSEVSELTRKSELYYLYQIVYLSITEPFPCAQSPETILNAAALVYNMISNCAYVHGVSLPDVLSALQNVASAVGAHHTAKVCLDILNNGKPDDSDVSSSNDNPDLLPVCYCCGYENSLIGKNSNDVCVNCGHPFIRCFINLDVLPLVEFKPSDECTDAEAIDLITNQDAGDSKALFDECIELALEDEPQVEGKTIPNIGKDVLASLDREDIFVIKSNCSTTLALTSNQCRFFKNVLPEIGIALCQDCHHFFHEEDFEFAVLRDTGCPFCRCHVIGKNYGHV